MLHLLKNVIFDPSTTLTQIDQKVTMPQAVTIVALAGVVSAMPDIVEAAQPGSIQVTGAILLVIWSVVYTLILWFVSAIAAQMSAGWLMGGIGTLTTTLIALGVAAFVKLLGEGAETVLEILGYGDSPFALIFFGWYAMLIVIALREAHDLRTFRALVAGLVVGMGIFAVAVPLAPVEWSIVPAMTRKPFGPAAAGWDVADLPQETINVLENPSFEVPPAPVETDEEEPRQVFRQHPVAEGWQASGIKVRRMERREQPMLPRIEAQAIRDEAARRSGTASVLIKREGIPMGTPMAWACVQPLMDTDFKEERLRDLEQQEQSEEVVSMIQSLRETNAFDAQAGDELYYSVWVKGEDVVAGAGMVYVRQEGTQQAGRTYYTETVHGTFSDWKQLKLKVSLQQEPQIVAACVLLWGGGKLWADDAELLQRKPEEKPEEAPEQEEEPEVLLPDPPTP